MKLGESLRKERELRGITLEEISAQTRVNIRFLEAIEHDDLSALPAKAFAKGFLRSYARAVGLDEDLVLTNFEYCHHAIQPDNALENKTQNTTGRQSGRGVFIVLLLIILLLTAMIILYYQGVFQIQ
jgi:cytoskeletal protein RodZ